MDGQIIIQTETAVLKKAMPMVFQKHLSKLCGDHRLL